MDHLSEVGLYLTDLNRFDGSAEMLVTEMQHNSQLQKAFEMVFKNFFIPYFSFSKIS